MALQTVGVRLRSPPTYVLSVLEDVIIEGQAMRLRMNVPPVVPAQAGTQRLVAASQELCPGLRRDDGYVDSGIHRWIRWPQKGSRSAPRRA